MVDSRPEKQNGSSTLKPSIDQQSGGFVRSVHSFDQALGRLSNLLCPGAG
jgi:hypothetical protein